MARKKEATPAFPDLEANRHHATRNQSTLGNWLLFAKQCLRMFRKQLAKHGDDQWHYSLLCAPSTAAFLQYPIQQHSLRVQTLLLIALSLSSCAHLLSFRVSNILS